MADRPFTRLCGDDILDGLTQRIRDGILTDREVGTDYGHKSVDPVVQLQVHVEVGERY